MAGRDAIVRARTSAEVRWAESFDHITRRVESPIEEAMFWGLLSACDVASPVSLEGTWDEFIRQGGRTTPAACCITGCGYVIYIVPQFEVQLSGRCARIDLAVFAVTQVISGGATQLKIAVECDGHDFHERTREQAERDKRRDRDLQVEGWLVARFTGSEIWRDPHAAGAKVTEMIDDLGIKKRLASTTGGK